MSSGTGEPQLPRPVMAFGTPVLSYSWPDSDNLNSALEDLILTAEKKAGGITRSNVGGWHSTNDLLEWDAEPIRVLRERVARMTTAMTKAVAVATPSPRTFSYRFAGWANVSRHGDYNSVHNHPSALWSGTYYVRAGEPEPDTLVNGRLELLDPRTGINMVSPNNTVMQARYVITPAPGLMVMFPSWLNHLVHPFFGRGMRISIAFNALAAEPLASPQG
jgi:uncharacterized protein (TIGR02466 family)